MSAFKFRKEDFDLLEELYVYATPIEQTGSVATYELVDSDNTIYKEIDIEDSVILTGVLTLVSKRPFDGQAVVTEETEAVGTLADTTL
ncbi:hypothetical protein [Sphingobacterium deserti]|uniref:Uncharacterized protein n=1 Tax=Sphingobacterium deserti TaxID=1229276 RepID=A0A0B8SZA0_9SPHI|nr:hypothetical protein [Sphingobacterium deserti]KGE12726.1 hypothetical protein DI53_3465 [Sphingobacterium deserti]